MAETTPTPQEAQAGVAGALRDLSDNSRTLVRQEVAAAQREMWDKARQAAPAIALLAGAACFAAASAAASFRLSLRALEKSMSPTSAALTAAAVYAAAAGAAGTFGVWRLRQAGPLFPADTARQAAQDVADATREPGDADRG
jgi:hypothetical protein